MPPQYDTYLRNIYYNVISPASFSNLNKLWDYIKTEKNKPKNLSKAKLKKWLSYQDTVSVHTPSRLNFPREKIIVSALDQAWDMDLADLGNLKKYNDNITFILVVIDLLSRYCWLRPLKTKKAEEVQQAIKDIFNQDGRKPLRLRSDSGREFNNKILKDYLQTKDVHYFTTFSEKKANYAERLIRTIKGKLFKFMYDRQTFRYVDVLQDIAISYNNTIHSSIKMAPANVTKNNDLELYMQIYMPYVNKIARKAIKFSFNVGDWVRVSHSKHPFSKSYDEQFSEEIFTIRDRISSFPPRYLLEDSLGENIEGSFYEQELVFVPRDDDREYKIEKIIKYRKLNTKEALVKWYGYSAKFNTWVPVNQVKSYLAHSKQTKK